MTAGSRGTGPGASLRVLIAGGGTGGHVIPALAIGRALRDGCGAEVLFVGTARGLETRLVPEAGFGLELIRVGQLKGVSLATRARTLLDLPMGVVRCLGLLRRFRPDVVVGVGGYASGPAMMAAILLRVPTLAYEPNAVPGLANRLVGRWVSAAAVAFERTTGFFHHAVVTGVPVRGEIFAVSPWRWRGLPHLLITAGSQGAKVFNEMVPEIAEGLLKRVPGLTIMHQAGSRHVNTTEEAYARRGVGQDRVRVVAFLDDMPGAYQRCDLVLCRSGSTVAELAAAGRASVLVPYPYAADDHQRENAEVMVQAGASEMMLQTGLTAGALGNELARLLLDEVALERMAGRARALAKPGALGSITELVLALARRRG